MKKRIISTLMALAMLGALIVPSLAAETTEGATATLEEATQLYETMAALTYGPPLPEGSRIHAVNNCDLGFHCGDLTEGPGGASQKIPNYTKGSTELFGQIAENIWLLVIEVIEDGETVYYQNANYVCPKCGRNSWASYSNNNDPLGVPFKGSNIQVNHFSLPTQPPGYDGEVTLVFFKETLVNGVKEDADPGSFSFNIFKNGSAAPVNPALLTVGSYGTVQYTFSFTGETAEESNAARNALLGTYVIREEKDSDWTCTPESLSFRLEASVYSPYMEIVWIGLGEEEEPGFINSPALGALNVTVDVKQQNYLQDWRNVFEQEWRNVFEQEWRNVFEQEWRNVFEQEWRNVYEQEWRNVFEQEWRDVYEQEWRNVFEQEWRNVFEQEWRNVFEQEWREVYEQDWRKIYELDWRNVYTQDWRKIKAQDWREVYEQDWRNIIAPTYDRGEVQQGPFTGIYAKGGVAKGTEFKHGFFGNGGNAETWVKIPTNLAGKQWLILGTSNSNNHREEDNSYGFFVEVKDGYLVISYDHRFINANMRAEVLLNLADVNNGFNVSNNRHFYTGDEFWIPIPRVPLNGAFDIQASARLVGNGNNAKLEIVVGGDVYGNLAWSNKTKQDYICGAYVVNVGIESNKVASVKVVSAPTSEYEFELPEYIYLHPFVSSIRYYKDFEFRGWRVIGKENVDPRRNVGKPITIAGEDFIGELAGAPRQVGTELVGDRELVGPEDLPPTRLIGEEDVLPRRHTGSEDVGDPIPREPEYVGNPIPRGTEDVGAPIQREPEYVGDPMLIGPEDVGAPIQRDPEYVGDPKLFGQEDVGDPIPRGQEYVGDPKLIGPEDVGAPIARGTEDVGDRIPRGTEDVGAPIPRGTEDVDGLKLIGPEDVGNPIPRGDENVGAPKLIGPEDVGNPIPRGEENVGAPIPHGTEPVGDPRANGAPVPYTGALTLSIVGPSLDESVNVVGGAFNYLYQNLTPGVYTITLSGQGFTTVELTRTVVTGTVVSASIEDVVEGVTTTGAELDARTYRTKIADRTFGTQLDNRTYRTQIADRTFRTQIDDRTFRTQIADRTFGTQLDNRTIQIKIADRVFRTQLDNRTFETKIADRVFRTQLDSRTFETKIADRTYRTQIEDRTFETKIEDRTYRTQIEDRVIMFQLDPRYVRIQIGDRIIDVQIEDRIIVGNQLGERVIMKQLADIKACRDDACNGACGAVHNCCDKAAADLNYAVANYLDPYDFVCVHTLIKNLK